MAEKFSQFFHENYSLAPFLGVSNTAPTELSLDLTADVPLGDGTSTPFTAGYAPGYAPVTILASSASWLFINERKITNKLRYYFPEATGAWPPPMGWRISNKNTGDFLACGHIENSHAIPAGDRFKIEPNSFTIIIDDTKNKLVSNAYAQLLLSVFAGVSINPVTSFEVRFGLKDPEKDGDFGEISTAGYSPLVVDSSEMVAVSPSQVKNSVMFDAEDSRMFIPEAAIDSIVSLAVYVDGTPWFKGLLSNPLSLKEKENIRVPVNSLIIRGK